MFLRSLTSHMTRPVMPDDESLDYLPTQVVAEFLATHPALNLDGILYPSRQAAARGLNVVLFRKASRVLQLEIPKGTKLRANTGQFGHEEGDIDYSVTEERPPEPSADDPKPKPDLLDFQLSFENVFGLSNSDYREPTLTIDPDTLCVHIVTGVEVNSTAHEVSRHRWTRSKNMPRSHGDVLGSGEVQGPF
jgi:hypothetical protein